MLTVEQIEQVISQHILLEAYGRATCLCGWQYDETKPWARHLAETIHSIKE